MGSMILIDVNVLVYAKRQDSPDHAKFRTWLEEIIRSDSVFGMSELVLSSVVRILTHPRIFSAPTQLNEALQYVHSLHEQPCCLWSPPRHRPSPIFPRLPSAASA